MHIKCEIYNLEQNRQDPSLGDGEIWSTEYQLYQNIIISDGAHLYEVNEGKEVSDLCYKIYSPQIITVDGG